MKLAISGKGGVGKSTIAATLALLIARRGKRVLAVDADPDANLASALGIPESIRKTIVPISKQIDLIEERTGAKVSQYGQIFKLNPDVSDISERYSTPFQGISLLVLGAIKQGGGGCACPENVLLKSLVTDLLLYKDDVLVLDMEAGIEHLGRATAKGVDTMLIVVEPGQRSIDCATQIIRMSKEIGIEHVQLIANKIVDNTDRIFIDQAFPDGELVGVIPYSEKIRRADQKGSSILYEVDDALILLFEELLTRLMESIKE